MRLRIVLLVALVGITGAISALSSQPTLAATITVRNGTAYACTFTDLTTAVADAEPGDTITLDCPTDTTVTFTSQIVIDKELTIDGQFATFDGGDSTRFFTVTNTGNLALRRVTLQHGSAGVGGAIVNRGTLSITQSNLIDSKSLAPNSVGGGGAIENRGTLTITQSRFANNSSERYGGAIYSASKLSIRQSSFISNTARYNGGALYIVQGSLEAIASTFSANTATAVRPAAAGSTIFQNQTAGSTALRWSTIIQSQETVPALLLTKSITLEGVILGGVGSHCELNNPNVVAATNSLTNDDSCIEGSTASWENQDLLLDDVTTTTVNGIDQTYYPLLTDSPAIDAAGDVCREPESTDEPDIPDDASLAEVVAIAREYFNLDELDQVGTIRSQAFGGTEASCDIGAIEMTDDTPPIIATITLHDPPLLEGHDFYIDIAITDPVDQTAYQYVSVCATGDQVSSNIWAATYYANVGLMNVSLRIDCRPPDQDQFTIWIAVSDDVTVRDSFFTFDVLNVAPEITDFSTPTTAMTGEIITLNATATDVPADPLTYTYSCDGGTLIGGNQCRFNRGGSHNVGVLVDDGDGGQSSETRTIQVYDPANLCENQWNGSLRVADDCGRSERSISLPLDNYAELSLCVNRWNGATRASDRCSRSERLVTASGQDSLHICVNNWNGTLRVSDRCSRSEYGDWL